MPFTVTRLVAEDGALIDQVSHHDVRLNAGRKFKPGFAVPVEFEIDLDTEGRRMPTMFLVPAFVARKPFYESIVAGGVDNVDAYPALITNEETGERFDDYLLLNVVGKVACAHLEASSYEEIGPGMRMINRLVLDKTKLPDLHMFMLAEDINKIVISDRLHDHLQRAGFDDLYFEELPVE